MATTRPPEESTGVVVIGGGPGGYAAAFLAADRGMDVTLVDREANPGGVCLYRGCIPSKALLHVAKVIEDAADVTECGVRFSAPKIDLDRMRTWKDAVVGKMTSGLGQLAKRRKVRMVHGTAMFESPAVLAIDTSDGTRRLRFEHSVVATGSSPVRLPGFPDDPRIWDSTAALDLRSIPRRLLVVGGGYIGLELGSVYATLGSRVTVVEMTDSLLPGVDADLVKPLHRRLDSKFESIRLGTWVDAVRATADGLKATFEGDDTGSRTATFDAVLISVGRRPNSSGLGLENTSVAVDDHGFIEVDPQMRTAETTVFAIGDVVGQPMLAHKASHEGRIAIEVIAGEKVAFEPHAIPAVVFTDPEIAWAGLTEADARRAGRDVEVARFPWAASGRATTLGRDDGVTKLILDPSSGRVLGVGIAGPGAGELIAEGALAVEMGATATDLKLTIHPHPTLSETVMEAAEVFFGQSTHVHRPRRVR